MSVSSRNSILSLLAKHRVAANVLMLIMFIVGVFSLSKLNRQFFPNFTLDTVYISVAWSQASPEDMAKSVTQPLEEAVRTIPSLRKLTSSSLSGVSTLFLEFQDGTDMTKAIEEVNQRVAQVRNLPDGAEKPEVEEIVVYEAVGSILLSSSKLDLLELRQVAYDIERHFLNEGVGRVSFVGMPQLRLSIRFRPERLEALGMTLSQAATVIRQNSLDLPIGDVGALEISRSLRVLEQGRNVEDFSNMVLMSNANQVIRLSDVANIELEPQEDQPLLYANDNPAIRLIVERVESADTLEASEVLINWEQQYAPLLSDQVEVTVFDRYWILLEQRINVLLENGLSGMILVLLALYLFMRGRVAFWVALGIPSSFLLALYMLYLLDGSINMLSVFALIMSLGIIVDDAIVVGERALRNFEDGDDALTASVNSAHQMFFPVVASSLTTVAAFLPLLLVSGVIGKFLVVLPVVVICVIFASLVESFFVLPGHLNHALEKVKVNRSEGFRHRFDQKFKRFTDHRFAAFIAFCLRNRLSVLSATLGAFILSISVMQAGWVKFEFFPSTESQHLYLNTGFFAGSSSEQVEVYLDEALEALNQTKNSFDQDIVNLSIKRVGISGADERQRIDPTVGSIVVELLNPDERIIRNETFIKAWKSRLPKAVPGQAYASINERSGGPGGADLSIRLLGKDLTTLKRAAEALAERFTKLPGVSNVRDNLPYGQDQLIFELKPHAVAQGVTVEYLSGQLRSQLSSQLVQIYTQGKDEVEVRVMYDESTVGHLGVLENLNIQMMNGSYVPLSNLVHWRSQKGFARIRHFNAQPSIEVFADIDETQISLNELLPEIETVILPELIQQYGFSWRYAGSAEDQAVTMGDMKTGAIIGILLIYIILTWVFGSWGRPIVVMAIIPFSLIGAIIGHWFLGINLTILSMFGLFGLSGIVINDAIVLVTTYQTLKRKGRPINETLVETAKQRLRAVLLTSLTTIGGLIPLLFETSLQAQFLIPMAVSISFGLAVATVLVLIIVPVLLSLYEQWRRKLPF